MPDFRLDTEWLDGEGVNGAELSATFASLRIDVGGRPVTEIIDRRARTTRESVYVPLYPLAEWLVTNWWFLAYESDNPTKSGEPDFALRHALGASTDGYAFPNLTVTSSGARTRLVWGSDPSPWTRIEFLNRDSAVVDRAEFLEVCADLVERVVRRLVAFEIHGTFLQEEWAAIQAADADESSFCEVAAGLGWDPYDLVEKQQQQVVRLADELGELRGEAVPIIGTTDPLGDAERILSAVQTARSNRLHLERLKPLAESVGEGQLRGSPWELGYDLARQARDALHLDGQPIRTLDDLAEALGEDGGALNQVFQPLATLGDLRLIDGVVAGGEQGSYAFGLRRAGESGQRFTFCRALGEAITSHTDALVTRGDTERQQRNRAFAAEFLAPSSGLRERISHWLVGPDEVDDLAEEYGVSPYVIRYQIGNHGIARLAGEPLTR